MTAAFCQHQLLGIATPCFHSGSLASHTGFAFCRGTPTPQEHVLSAATHHHNNDLNIYEGYKVRGKVTVTISRGRVVWENGQLNVEKGSGRYVPLPVHGPLFDGLEEREQRARRVEFPYGPVPVDRRSCAGEDQCEGMHAPFGVHGSWA